MSDPHRTSRADRRRAPGARENDRRQPNPVRAMSAYSQQQGNELQVFVQNAMTADNCAVARDVLRTHCQRAKTPVLVIDMEKCGYMDTLGLSLLFELRKEALSQDRQFIVQNPSRAVLRMMNITRMHRVFQMRSLSIDLEKIPGSKSDIAVLETSVSHQPVFDVVKSIPIEANQSGDNGTDS